jgi:hypothetical protein
MSFVTHFGIYTIKTHFLFRQPNSLAAQCSFKYDVEHSLLPVTRFSDKELEDAIHGMEFVLQRQTLRL